MYLTTYSRAALADFARGLGITLPSQWWVGLVSSVDGANDPTELVDSNYFRASIPRSLAAWAGTQGAGTTLASSGTSNETSNNVTIDWGSLSGSWGVATHVALYDDETGGNPWFVVPIEAINLQSGSPASLQPGALRLVFGIISGTSNYLANKLIDLILRDQAWDWPATAYIGYTRTASTNSTPGQEPSTGTGYAREAVAANDTEWDLDGDGEIANADTIQFNPRVLAQGDIVGHIYMDAASGGNMLFWGDMDNAPITLPASDQGASFQPLELRYYFA